MNQKLLVDSFALSPMQVGMLFHYLKDPHSGVDIQQLVLHLPEAVDAHRLETAWQWLVHRHDILRAKFAWEEAGQPKQEILSEVLVPFVSKDCRHLSVADQKAHLQVFLDNDRAQGIDFSLAPMMRLNLFQWAPTSYSLVWTFQHALLDGRCYPILLQQVFDAYAELEEGNIKERPPAYSYRRYIDWLQTREIAESEAFWKSLLTGFSAPTPLVVDRLVPPGAITTQQGEAWDGLNAAITARLRSVASQYSLTVNSFFYGCLGYSASSIFR